MENKTSKIRGVHQQRPRTAASKDDSISTTNRQEIEYDLAKLKGTYCPTAVDKYQILLKRDNLMSKLQIKSTDIKKAKKLSSSCVDMCPEKERYMRQVGNLLHPYECFSNGTVNHSAAVKEYARSAADQDEPLPHELRTPEVLKKTMDYLILKIAAPIQKTELGRWYDFIWSRTRSIRKEITQQMLVDESAVALVEKCVRFHIYASFRMADLGTKDFDETINTENLSKCLQTLRHLYDDLARKSIFLNSEAEFRAYDVLLNLANSNVLSVTHTYRKNIRDSGLFKFAMKLSCYFQTDNYVAFFRLLRSQASFLQACLCRTYFNEIRANALHSIVKVTRPAKVSLPQYQINVVGFPIPKLTELLAFDNEKDTLEFMNALDLYPESDEMIRIGDRYSVNDDLLDEKNHGCRVIVEKLNEPLSTIISGGPFESPVFSTPENSFINDYYGGPTNAGQSKLLSLSQSSSLTSSQSTAMKSLFSSEQQKPLSQASTSAMSFTNNFGQKQPTSKTNQLNTALFPDRLSQKQSSSFGSNQFSSGFGQKQPSTSTFGKTSESLLEAKKSEIQPSPTQKTNEEPSAEFTFKIKASPAFPTTQVITKEPTIELPSDFDQKAKDRLVDNVLDFCVDDFIWLAAHETRRRVEEEALAAKQNKMREFNDQKIKNIGQKFKSQLFDDVLGFCVDDFVWLAAQNVRRREQRVEVMLEKHNLRIVKPYAKKWLSAMQFRMFLSRLPDISNRKRLSQTQIDSPDSKRSKKFIPLKFSTKY